MSTPDPTPDRETFAQGMVHLFPHVNPEEHLEEHFMVSAALGTLDDQDRQRVVSHLAGCAACRATLQFMMEEEEEEKRRIVRPLVFRRNLVRFALAACLLLGMGLWLFVREKQSTDSLELARMALREGEPGKAYALLTRSLEHPNLSDDQRVQVLAMLPEAAASWGKQLLLANDFEKALGLVEEMRARGLTSSEMDVLAFSATLRSTRSVVLEDRIALADIGVRVGEEGELLRLQSKSLDEISRRLGTLIQSAKKQEPTDRAVRLNYAYWLLLQNRGKLARPLFEELLRTTDDDRAAWVGLGLAAVLMEDAATATRAFLKAQELNDDDAIKANLEAARQLRHP